MEEEKREPTITELLNIIKLLESTLKFYADENNYDEKLLPSLVSSDRGHMARYALKELKVISEYETSLLDEIKKISNQIEESGIDEFGDSDPDQFKNLIKQLKQINDSIKH